MKDAGRAAAAELARREHTRKHDIEAVTRLALDDGGSAGRKLLAHHQLCELVQPVSRKLGEELTARQLGHRRRYVPRAHGPIVARVGTLVGWKHCPRCSAPLESDGRSANCGECGYVAYAGPEPTVCALVLDDAGRVLLARRKFEPDAGKWDVPGGFLEEDEEALDGLRRELREETGLEIEPLELAGIWADRYGGGDNATATLNLYWTARIVSGEPTAADDVAELRWFSLDDLPPDEEMAFENVAKALHSRR
jgi:ADP-ribose pyrophosphatase YjhB (NUDIX family)